MSAELNYPIVVNQSANWTRTFVWSTTTSKAIVSNPVDLTAARAVLEVRSLATSSSTPLVTLTSPNSVALGGANGTVTVSFAPADTSQLTPGQMYRYDCIITLGSGIAWRLLEGTFLVAPSVTSIAGLPILLSGCVFWVRADLGSPTSSRWPDQSGGGHDLTSTVGPTLSPTAIGGRPGMVFNGSNQWMQTQNAIDLSAATKATAFVAGLGSLTPTGVLLEQGASVSGGNGRIAIFSHFVSSGDIGFAMGGSGGNQTNFGTFSPASFSNPSQMNCIYDTTIASGLQETARFNRAPVTLVAGSNGNATALTSGVFNVGARNGGASFFANCTIGEIIIYNRALSASEIALIENYMSALWSTP